MGLNRLLSSTTGVLNPPSDRGEFVANEGSLSFWELWLYYRPMLVRDIARYRAPANTDEADFRQAVLERVERKCKKAFDAFQGRSSVAWYLRRVARSAVVDEIRARKRANLGRCPLPGHSFVSCDPEAPVNVPGPGADEPASEVERSDRTDKLNQAIQALAAESDESLRIARAVVWRCVDLRPRQEIALDLGVSVRQVNRYILAGLCRLRSILGQTYGVLNEEDL